MRSPSLEDAAGGLADIQSALADRILRRRPGVPSALDARTARRFEIHCANVGARLLETLRSRFPVVERLTGAPRFTALASSFIADHPPRSPVLLDYGALLPTFIAATPQAARLAPLTDIARLEWLRHVARHAADAEPLDPAPFARLPRSTLGDIRFAFHPATRLLASPHPIVSIWTAHAGDAPARPVGPRAGAEAALVVRPHDEVRIMRFDPAAHAFAETLGRGATLAEAAAEASRRHAGFSLDRAFGTLIRAGALMAG